MLQVDLRHIDELNGTNIVEVGVDLSEFYTSVEWDILEVPAVRYVRKFCVFPSSHVKLIKNIFLFYPFLLSSCIVLFYVK